MRIVYAGGIGAEADAAGADAAAAGERGAVATSMGTWKHKTRLRLLSATNRRR